jgi:predicted nucleotidyltransferase
MQMKKHQDIVKEISQELYENENILALFLFGSVSRHEETSNSDIDLLSITTETHFQVRHEVRHEIEVEFYDMHIDFLKFFIEGKDYEIPLAIAKGTILFNKIPELEPLIIESKKVIQDAPVVYNNWGDEKYVLRKRRHITDKYKDLLDIDDELSFNYVVALFIADIMPMLNDLFLLRPQSNKKTMAYLKSECHDSYTFMEILLSATSPIPEKRNAAKGLIEFVLKAHGGLLEGNYIFHTVNSIDDMRPPAK